MLDIKFIRENKDIVAAGAKKKHIEIDLDKLLTADDRRRELQLSIDEKRAEQNIASDAIAAAKNDSGKHEVIARMQGVKETLRLAEESMQEVMKEWRAMMVMVPNVPDMSVPDGDSDADNQEIRRWSPASGDGGEAPASDFEPKTHSELLLAHDMADYERGAKVAGFRGYFLKGDGARLVWALEQFVQDRFFGQSLPAGRQGFTPMIVPSMVRREPFVGTGYLPQSEEDLYKTQDGDYLAGTAEVATMGYYMEEVLDKKD